MENDNKEPVSEPKSEKLAKFWAFCWEIIKVAVIAFVIVAPIRYFLFQPFIVSGASMSPNFETGDYLIIDEISYRLSEPQRGDVVVFNTNFIPNYSGQRFIKRIVGLPGETVKITKGKVEIEKNGKKEVLKEKYLPDDLKTYGDANVTLKGDQYFVLGDNRTYSYDSRMWGGLPKKQIIGKAFLRILPITELGQITNPSY